MRPSTHPSVLSYRLPGYGRVLQPVRSVRHEATVQKIARVAASLRRPLGAAAQPSEPAPPLRHRHAPHAGFLALELVSPAALVGLVDGLPADAERVPDLGPGRAVAACCTGQQIAYICQGVLGVSHLPKGVQWPLGAAQRPRQVLDHPAGPQPRVGGLFGAHVNGYWQRPRTPEYTAASIPVGALIAANCCKQSISGKEVNGAPSGDTSPPVIT